MDLRSAQQARINGFPGRVPARIRLAYGSGSIAEGTLNTAFNVFLVFYYNQVLGLPGTLAGTAILIALCFDAVTDPLVGFLSDRHHSRLGRRHPFIYASALPMAACIYLIFNPPDGLGERGLFAWLTVFAVGARGAFTLYQIPANSMIPEITRDYDERTTLVSLRFLFGMIGGVCVAQLGYLHFFAPSDAFADGRLQPEAYGGFATVCAFLAVAAIAACAVGTHPAIPLLRTPPEKTATRFWTEVRQVLANTSFRMIVGAALLASVAGGFTEVMGLYMNTYFWEFSTEQISAIVWGLVASVAIAAGSARRLTRRFDKKGTAMALGFFIVFFGPAAVVLRLLDWMPANGHPLLLPLIVGHSVLLVTASVAIGIVMSSMIADLVDENELVAGTRQEGMFASTIAFTGKATSGLGGFLAGVALDVIAFPRGAEPGSVPPEKLFGLGAIVGPGLLLLYLVTLVFFSRYRLSRADHERILGALASRSAPQFPPGDEIS
jgi:Na+/melibiose symporter-like transporter